jgi:mutator protein MutT
MDSSPSGSVIDVAVALVWRQGCVLITRRPAHVHMGGFWEFPGGKCLPGETPEACAEREILEEVGVACRARSRRPVIEHTYPEKSVRLFPIDCDYLGGGPRPIEVTEWAWATPSQLGDYEFPPANAPLVAALAGTERSGTE